VGDLRESRIRAKNSAQEFPGTERFKCIEPSFIIVIFHEDFIATLVLLCLFCHYTRNRMHSPIVKLVFILASEECMHLLHIHMLTSVGTFL
jgi:hypothetical protein